MTSSCVNWAFAWPRRPDNPEPGLRSGGAGNPDRLMIMRWLTAALLLTLLQACAPLPRQELDASDYLLKRAEEAQAALYAADDYQAARSAHQEALDLIEAGRYRRAAESLAVSRRYALSAFTASTAAREREAEEAEVRRRTEEARRQAEAAAQHKAEEEARRRAEVEARKAAERLAEYRVTAQDTLASIAALPGVYGDPLLWPLLYQGNRDQIKDPAQIFPGQTLHIPRGQLPGDLELARQKAREAGLFGIPPASRAAPK